MMGGMRSIIKKELRTYFYSPVAYVIIGLFLFIMGVIFGKVRPHLSELSRSAALWGGPGDHTG